MTTPAPTETKTPLRWRLVIGFGILSGLLWTAIIFGSAFSKITWLPYFVAVPAMIAGIYVGRKIPDRPVVHGLALGGFAFLSALATSAPLVTSMMSSEAVKTMTGNPNQETFTVAGVLVSLGSQMLLTLVLFGAYGVIMSFNSVKRTKAYREEMDRRGGSLQRAGRVLNLLDLQLLPLPKFSSWVLQLFRSNGFKLDDYHIGEDKTDLYLRRTEGDERWIVRCVNTEALKPGQIQALDQEMRSSNEYAKGVLITSRSVQDGTRKWVKGRKNLEVLDGETLWEMYSA